MTTDLSKQTDATDLEVISFFEIDPDCNRLRDALDARGTTVLHHGESSPTDYYIAEV